MSGITAALEDGLLILTMDKPARRNFSDAEPNPAICAVVLTGIGGNYSAGRDIRDLKATASFAEARDRFAVVKDLIGRIVRFPKPLVSAVEGWAVGAGFGIALACERVVAAETTSIGAGPGPRLFVTSVAIDAKDGKRLGFVDALAPKGEALTKPKAIAQEEASVAPLARSYIKDFLAQKADRARIRTPDPADAVEGRAAFFEKRAPIFRGE